MSHTQSSGRSRPLDKSGGWGVGGGGWGDWSFGPQFGLKIRGAGGRPSGPLLLDLPLQRIYPDT